MVSELDLECLVVISQAWKETAIGHVGGLCAGLHTYTTGVLRAGSGRAVAIHQRSPRQLLLFQFSDEGTGYTEVLNVLQE